MFGFTHDELPVFIIFLFTFFVCFSMLKKNIKNESDKLINNNYLIAMSLSIFSLIVLFLYGLYMNFINISVENKEFNFFYITSILASMSLFIIGLHGLINCKKIKDKIFCFISFYVFIMSFASLFLTILMHIGYFDI